MHSSSYFVPTPKAKNVLEVYNEAKKLRENSKKKNELDRQYFHVTKRQVFRLLETNIQT